MKELSIEEKAKRYDDAINAIKELKAKHPIAHVIKDWIKENFPELAESKDERIRKALKEYFINSFQNNGVAAICGVHIKDILVWLEKQGEQKPVEFDDTNAKRMFIKALERVEEQNNKGYKLTDCDKNSWWEDFKAYTSCTIEQKSAAWSDEDEKQARQIERIVHNDGCTQKLQKQIADWFKSLKERCNWKPSDEQMNALNYVVNLMASSERPTENDLYYNILKSLKEQLKRLREE